jgi:hypothetical protein
VTKNKVIIVINLVTPKAAAKRELWFNKPASSDDNFILKHKEFNLVPKLN